MNTQKELERIVQDWLGDRVVEPQLSGLRDVLEVVSRTPQARRRSLGRWLNHPADKDRRNRLMLGATALTAAVVVPALAVGTLPRSQENAPAAGGGTTHTVAPEGGDFSTIGEAVAAAADGDTIMVKPGTYTEAITIDKDIILMGDGPREDIVIQWNAGGPTQDIDAGEADPWKAPFGVLVDGSDATVSGLTLSGPAEGVSLIIRGGAPLVEDLAIDMDPGTMEPESYPRVAVFIGATACADSDCEAVPADATIRGSAWDAYLALREGSSATIEGNTISVDVVSVDGPGRSNLIGNTFMDGASTSLSADAAGLVEGNDFTSGNIGVDSGSDVIVRGNVFRDVAAGEAAIVVRDAGSSAEVIDNEVADYTVGIYVQPGSTATISGNQLSGNGTGLILQGTSSSVFGNVISAGRAGIVATLGAVELVDNVVEGATARGLALGAQLTDPVVTGNRSCGNGENLYIVDGAVYEVDLAANDICEDAPEA